MFFRLAIGANHPLDGVPLAYVHWFTRPSMCIEEPVHMCAVKRVRGNDRSPLAGIIAVDSISRFIQLIPKFPNNSHAFQNMDPDSFMEQTDTFLVNSFADMEIYQAVC
jgi:hypothetical protein